MKIQVRLLSVFACVALSVPAAFAQGSLTPPGAPGATMKTLAQIEPRTPIESLPYTITSPGSYYLAGNLTSLGNGIVVTCGNVAIDLMGFAMGGEGTGTGILVEPTSGALRTLSVRNGTIRGFGIGIQWEGVRGSVLADLVVESNAWHGIYFMGNGAPASENHIEHCTVYGNAGNGIFFSSYSVANHCNDNRVEDCLVAQNGQYGVALDGSGSAQCDGNVVQNVTASRNGIGGIYLLGTGGSCSGNTIKNCQASGNTSSGIKATAGCLRNRIEGNTTTGNSKGLDVYGSGNYVADNMVAGNTNNYDFGPDNQLNLLLGEIPQTIAWPCSIRLAGSLTCTQTGVNGIMVNANDVTIDLGGHALTGPGLGSLSGIFQDSAFRTLRVRNGMLVNWVASIGGAGAGLRAEGVGTMVSDVQAITNNYGIYCTGDGGLIERCGFQYNAAAGLYLGGSGGTINDCSALYNSGVGISAARANLKGCKANGNVGTGIEAEDQSILTECSSTYNHSNGFSISVGCLVDDCVSMYNWADGLKAHRDCLIFNSQFSFNGQFGDGAGIRTSGANNRLDSNLLSYNDVGIVAILGGNFIVRNSVRSVASTNAYVISTGNGDAHVVVPSSGFTNSEPWVNFRL